MFEQVLGLPAHPLLLHAAVVFIPLLGIGAIAYALVPFLRSHIWWAVGLLAVVGAACSFVTRESGFAFRDRLVAKGASGDLLARIDQHGSYGNKTMLFTIALGVVTLALIAATPGWRRGSRAAHRVAAGRVAEHRVAERRVAEPALSTVGVGADLTGPPPADTPAERPVAAGGGVGGRLLRVVLAVATVVLAGFSLYYVFKTGDSGARIVWSGS